MEGKDRVGNRNHTIPIGVRPDEVRRLETSSEDYQHESQEDSPRHTYLQDEISTKLEGYKKSNASFPKATGIPWQETCEPMGRVEAQALKMPGCRKASPRSSCPAGRADVSVALQLRGLH